MPKEGDFEPASFVDHYEQALVEVIRKNQAHVPLKKSTERVSAPKNFVSLIDALRRSVANDAGKPEGTGHDERKKSAEGQREMLLPTLARRRKSPKKPSRWRGRRANLAST
ncbi:MAG: Ku protein [Betaproteobacteria bacterium]|jgi:DNA end-binding protein Ku|nr:Ku protein [Betaproteobacteria bacterium]